MLLTIAVCVIAVSYAEAACRVGWTQGDGHCYYVSHDTETWVDAMAFCKLLGGYLVEIDDAGENNFVKNLLIHANHGEAWIGGTDTPLEGVWRWLNSDRPVTYSNWKQGEPNSSGGTENCMEMRNTGLWNDDVCHDFEQFVCESDGESGEVVIG